MAGDIAGERHAALASPIRRDILGLIADSRDPVDSARVAKHYGIHVTTARFHLEQLEHAGLLRRESVRHTGRGRPRIAFRIVPGAVEERPVRELANALADALSHDPDGGSGRAEKAGERWSQAYEVPPATNAAGRVDALSEVFDEFGFEPEVRGEGDKKVMALHGCPFRDAALAHPGVVCAAHQGLLAGVLNRLGSDQDDATLQPFVGPELCMVRMRGSLVKD